MLKRATIVLAFLLSLASTGALAQSSPNFSYGQVPTAGQWNAAFASKQDLLNFTPLNLSGGTMRGKFNTTASTVNGAGLAVLPGIAPTSPANGDMWITNAGFFVQVNGQTVSLINQGTTPVLPISSGGTGATSASAARSNLGAAGSGANTDITSLNGPSLGAATATTPSAGDNSTRVATTAALTTAISSVAGAYAGQITGLLPTAIPTGSTVTISAGSASDSTNAAMISGGPFSWAASNGNAANGYQGGTTLPASSTIHFFAIKGTSGVASFASTSLTPTLPTGYTLSRRIFSLRTDGSGALIGGVPVETAGGAITFWLNVPTLDINGVAAASASRSLLALNVPTGIRVQPLYRANNNGTTVAVNLSSGDEPDVALPQGGNAAWTAAPGLDFDLNTTGLNVTGSSAQVGVLTTNTSGQIGVRAFSGQAGALYWVTRGFVDFRRN